MSIDKTIRYLLYSIVGLTVLLVAGIILQYVGKSEVLSVSIAPSGSKDQVYSCEITGPGSTYQLVRENAGWNVKSNSLHVPAMPTMVQDYLTVMYKTAALRKTANGPDQYGDVGMTDSSIITLVLKDKAGTVLITYKTVVSATNRSVYARLGDDGPVYDVGTDLLAYVNLTAGEWADKRFWPVQDEKAVQSFSIEKSGTPADRFGFDKDKKTWSGQGSAEAQKASSTDIASFMRQVLTLDGSAIEVLDAVAVAERLKTMSKQYTIVLTSDQSYNVELWRKGEEGDYLVIPQYQRLSVDGKNIVFSIAPWKLGDLKVQVQAVPAGPTTGS